VTRPHVPHFVRAAHRDAVIAFVLAALVALFFPVAASTGTETHVLRYVTAGVVALAGVLMHFGGRRPAFFVAGCGLLAVVAFPLHAVWLAGLAGLCALDAGIARLRDRAETGRGLPPPVPDAPEDGEAPSDIIESVAIAFVYALVVREFTCEAFKIPTGSMQPTIMGEQNGRRRGDHLLAGKAPLLFCDPQRWSIVVFKYPLFRPTNYIKRLVGLPGELLEIRDGDIYVNGKVVSKPDDVQETLWFPLLPHDDGEWPLGGADDAFRREGGGEWRFEGDGATGTAPAGEASWIVHDRKVRGGWDVGVEDSRVSFDLDASSLGGGTVFVRLDGGGRRVEFEAGREGVWMTAPGAARTKLDVGGLGGSKERWSFSVADRVVRVARDGHQVARVVTADEENLPAKRDNTWIGVAGGTAKVTSIALERDLQYTQRGGGKWNVPEGCYFMLGDNTTASRDSREWMGKVFKMKDGRRFVCDQSEIRVDDERSSPSVRVTPDQNGYEIWDSYGAHRVLAKSEIEGGNYKLEPQPFVRREDLVGRAFFIFFPFRSDGSWRPRILP
jgi:signal peptidase I